PRHSKKRRGVTRLADEHPERHLGWHKQIRDLVFGAAGTAHAADVPGIENAEGLTRRQRLPRLGPACSVRGRDHEAEHNPARLVDAARPAPTAADAVSAFDDLAAPERRIGAGDAACPLSGHGAGALRRQIAEKNAGADTESKVPGGR